MSSVEYGDQHLHRRSSRDDSDKSNVQNTKRQRKSGIGGGGSNVHWKDAPSFLDATASVSAATFGSRRLPELQRLYHATLTKTKDENDLLTNQTVYRNFIKAETPLLSGGGKRSSRHLRRRTTAVESKKHYHRYPRNIRSTLDPVTDPRNEIHASVKEDHTFMEYQGNTRKSQRKKRSLLLQNHTSTWLMDTVKHETETTTTTTTTTTNDQELTSMAKSESTKESTAASKWLITHYWHAKRFHMATLWDGWRVPLAHTNRGSRAALRLSQTNHDDDSTGSNEGRYVLLRDMSWERQPLVFKATQIRTEADLAWLLQTLQRVCPDVATTDSNRNKAFLGGFMAKECMLHRLDQFPIGAIGPVILRLVTVKKYNNNNDDDDDDKHPIMEWMIEVRSHPSIRLDVIETMQSLVGELDRETKKDDTAVSLPIIQWSKNNEYNQKLSPRICFRLYGKASTTILKHLLISDEKDHSNNQMLQDCNWMITNSVLLDDETTIPHGTIIRIRNARIVSPTDEVVTKVTGDIIKEGKKDVQTLLRNEIASRDLLSPTCGMDIATCNDTDLVLVYQAPRPLNCPANYAMSGWEVYCHKFDVAHQLWMALSLFDATATTATTTTTIPARTSTHGIRSSQISCCAVGLVEECHLRMECEPPLPLFPRDFVDTRQSQIYWNNEHDKASHHGPNDRVSNWKYLRHLYEGGWGRLPLKKDWATKIKTHPVEFQSLLEEDTTTTTTTTSVANSPIVVVRNAFGQPFVDVIECCTPKETLERSTSTTNERCSQQQQQQQQRKRKRRKVLPSDRVLISPPLPRSQRESFSNLCQQLLASLSLPAILVCHVRIIGKGTIDAGDEIVGSELTLGRITAGTFSISRGVCHGMGVVGAARLLQYLSQWCTEDTNQQRMMNCGRIVPLSNGQRSFQLAVSIRPLSAFGTTTTTTTNTVSTTTNEACMTVLID
ncbi:ribonuclease P/MRP domain containing protein [Nitzschia inconspicua]|uniref:Ribonuclease P/MRP domain containing protein n=1 Tax=Nitzschia inconspicua TaxID=303405 RepID=A0A9K3LBP2_9STRA|nr:ribonuclease P/MRP domain containing protein [Nitzschia inconspicua]